MALSGRNDSLAEHFRRSIHVLQNAADDIEFHVTIGKIANSIEGALRAGHKLLLAGNGGSAADAQHIAAEFVSKFKFDRNPLAAIALTTDTSILTAIGNDYGFEHVFARQLRGLGHKGDIFVALSTSGRSPNVLAGLRTAREMGIATIGFTGSHDNPMLELCDECLVAPSEDTALIQQVHMVAAHAVCEAIEIKLFN